ncbi:epimerase [Parapedobacter pyrenivorans]|uniref:Epimerase n=1 Tax=Parapedobacter pyrenivorans TaxID=1305674 RepID=A0A917M645_9SPHI|nr:NAD-dependent epimerase/dehydratase family protein [Parapedobacter pyrenivorans]GGG79730.1 epimerase [Parapedobacter pyrenivorans]
MDTTTALYQAYLRPSAELIADVAALNDDILILGAGGKMGPSLALLAKQAMDLAGLSTKVIAVSRFSEPGILRTLNAAGVTTIQADLLDDSDLQRLPTATHVLYLAGTKFGTTGNEGITWAMNSYLPGRIAQQFKSSNMVVFSTGNVYPLTPVAEGGATEETPPAPIGEYAQSCLGRERLFQYYAGLHQTPTLVYRLNYANDVSYGVLLEIAKSVFSGREISLAMGHVNVIWQHDANEMALRSLLHCQYPARILNISGPETVSIRWAAHEFGKLFGRSPIFVDEEQPSALLSNAAEAFRIFGYPKVTLKQMIELIAKWVEEDGRTLNKPTHFQEREGKF